MSELSIADFVPSYPDPYDPGIQNFVGQSQEFVEKSSLPRETVRRGEYFRHQIQLLRYLTQYDRCFNISETGTGKSCDFVLLAEFMRKNRHIKKIYVLERGGPTRDEFKMQIGCRCTDGAFDIVGRNVRNRRKTMNIAIGRVYEVTTYYSFANPIFKKNWSDEKIIEEFSDCLFLVDEAHNLRNAKESMDKKEPGEKKKRAAPKKKSKEEKSKERVNVYETIWRVFHLAQRTKIMVSTATPMINDVNGELYKLLNLLLPVGRQIPSNWIYGAFNSDNGHQYLDFNVNLNLMERYFRGIVTFVRNLDTGLNIQYQGANITDNKGKTITRELHYVDEKWAPDELEVKSRPSNGSKYIPTVVPQPEIDEENRHTVDIKSQMVIYSSLMIGIQADVYRQKSTTLSRSGPSVYDDTAIEEYNEDTKGNNILRQDIQAAAFVFPDGSIGGSDKPGAGGERGFSKYIVEVQKSPVQTFAPRVDETIDFKEILCDDVKLQQYGCKVLAILNIEAPSYTSKSSEKRSPESKESTAERSEKTPESKDIRADNRDTGREREGKKKTPGRITFGAQPKDNRVKEKTVERSEKTPESKEKTPESKEKKIPISRRPFRVPPKDIRGKEETIERSEKTPERKAVNESAIAETPSEEKKTPEAKESKEEKKTPGAIIGRGGKPKTFVRRAIVRPATAYEPIITSVTHNGIARRYVPTRGCSFIFVDAVYGAGVYLLGLSFEARGFKRFDESKSVMQPSNQSEDSACISPTSSLDPRFTKYPRYAILTSKNARFWPHILEVFNSKENMHGEYIQVIIGSQVSRDGINLSNVVRNHLFIPGWHLSGTHQAMSRSIRATSHEMLLEELRRSHPDGDERIEVKIYYHAAVLENNETSIDIQIYRRSEDKNILIRRLMRYLKQCAFDYKVNTLRNILSPQFNYSRECDYDICDYKCYADIAGTQNESKVQNIDGMHNYDILYLDDTLVQCGKDIVDALVKYNYLNIYDLYSNTLWEAKYRKKYIIMALDRLISTKYKFTNAFGYLCYVGTDGLNVYMQREYPLNEIVDTRLLRPNYSQDIIALLLQPFSNLTTQAQLADYKSIMDSIRSEDVKQDGWDENILQKLADVNIEVQIKAFEESTLRIFSPDNKVNMDPIDFVIHTKFSSHFLQLGVPPTDLIRRVREYNPNQLGDDKKCDAKLSENLKSVNIDFKNSDVPIIMIHNIYSMVKSKAGFSVATLFNKVLSRIRVYNRNETVGWRDATPLEYCAYKYLLERKFKDDIDDFLVGIDLKKPYGKVTSRDGGLFRLVFPDANADPQRITVEELQKDKKEVVYGIPLPNVPYAPRYEMIDYLSGEIYSYDELLNKSISDLRNLYIREFILRYQRKSRDEIFQTTTSNEMINYLSEKYDRKELSDMTVPDLQNLYIKEYTIKFIQDGRERFKDKTLDEMIGMYQHETIIRYLSKRKARINREVLEKIDRDTLNFMYQTAKLSDASTGRGTVCSSLDIRVLYEIMCDEGIMPEVDEEEKKDTTEYEEKVRLLVEEYNFDRDEIKEMNQDDVEELYEVEKMKNFLVDGTGKKIYSSAAELEEFIGKGDNQNNERLRFLYRCVSRSIALKYKKKEISPLIEEHLRKEGRVFVR